jgi:L-lactate utilization protein LutB
MHVASMLPERAHGVSMTQPQQNLQKFRGKFVTKRREAMTELDDFEGTRDAGQAIRQRAPPTSTHGSRC